MRIMVQGLGKKLDPISKIMSAKGQKAWLKW
jgi:hypothetical protein